MEWKPGGREFKMSMAKRKGTRERETGERENVECHVSDRVSLACLSRNGGTQSHGAWPSA